MKLDEVSQFIADLAKSGKITPEQIVNAAKARPKNDPVYLRYWSLSDADEAHRSRLDRARSDLHRFKVIITTETHRLECPVYVRDPTKDEATQGYASVRELALRQEEAVESYRHELRRLATWVHRVQALGINLEIDRLIPNLTEELHDMAAQLLQYEQHLGIPPAPPSSSKGSTRTGRRAS